MKLWKKIVLSIIALIIAATAFVTVWQWENIKALYLFATNTDEQIEKMAEESHKTKEEVLSQYEGITVTDLTPEQENAIISGEMTVEEAVKEIDKSDTAVNESKPQKQETKPVDKKTEIVNKYLKQIYALKAEFLGKLANLKDEAQAEFYKFPLPERTKANKTAVMTDKLIDCYELENQCDIKIEALLKELKTELEKINADTAIVAEIRKAYKEEKSVKKAYYIKLASD
ncbi:MAG: hypothetical protein IKU84_07600 [Clostridia bacterium]|nr:hypothetical protein [Clostridia bacterium]